jgi:hypothetical protein
MARPIIDREEMYAPRTLFVHLGGFNDSDFTKFVQKYGVNVNGDNLYPIFEIMTHMNKERKTRHGLKTDEMSGLDTQKRYEEVMKLRIINQERAGLLIPRSVAKDRVRVAFTTVANKIRWSIKNVAPRLIGVTNARDVENMLTQSYNNALEDLETQSKNITWEEDGRKVEFGRTELVEDSGEDFSSGSSDQTETTDQE